MRSGAPTQGGIEVGDLIDPLGQGPQVGVGSDGPKVGDQRPRVIRAFTLSRAADLYSQAPGADRAVAEEPTTAASSRRRGWGSGGQDSALVQSCGLGPLRLPLGNDQA